MVVQGGDKKKRQVPPSFCDSYSFTNNQIVRNANSKPNDIPAQIGIRDPKKDIAVANVMAIKGFSNNLRFMRLGIEAFF